LWKCTPVAVKATAGLKLLGEKQSKDILDAVANRLRVKYEFHLRSNEDVAVLDGKDEGVFAWITANDLLHTIGGSATGNQRIPEKTPTFVVLDLGGASTQIVFEPLFDEKQPDSMLKEGEHKYDLTFGGDTGIVAWSFPNRTTFPVVLRTTNTQRRRYVICTLCWTSHRYERWLRRLLGTPLPLTLLRIPDFPCSLSRCRLLLLLRFPRYSLFPMCFTIILLWLMVLRILFCDPGLVFLVLLRYLPLSSFTWYCDVT
jgi:hypothetical protein